jgi:hypothetical protein
LTSWYSALAGWREVSNDGSSVEVVAGVQGGGGADPDRSCISTIKNELIKRRTFTTRDQARLAA